jgi:hypothetical protein
MWLQKNAKVLMQRNHRQALPEENGCVGEPKWLEPISKRADLKNKSV